MHSLTNARINAFNRLWFKTALPHWIVLRAAWPSTIRPALPWVVGSVTLTGVLVLIAAVGGEVLLGDTLPNAGFYLGALTFAALSLVQGVVGLMFFSEERR